MTLTDNYNNVIIISIDPSNNRYSSTRLHHEYEYSSTPLSIVRSVLQHSSTRVLDYSSINTTKPKMLTFACAH